MNHLRVVVTDYIEPDLRWEAEQLGAYPDISFAAHQLKGAPQDELIAAVREADVIVVNMVPFTAAVIEALARCRLIIRHGIGYDNVDLSAATRKGIWVANVPDYCPEEVAEHALALLFAVWRRIFAGRRVLEESVQRGAWDFSSLGPIQRLSGKTLGVVGCGRIGSRVVRRAEGLGLRVLAVDPYLAPERRAALPAPIRPLAEVLRESDIITLHAPLNEETRHMIDDTRLALMKEQAILVNTARGGLVDLDALVRALKEKKIAGAALDVYEQEPPPPGHELLALDNVVLSPHLGWYSEEACWDIRGKILQDILRFWRGQPPRFIVNQ